jgi:hypothetical protein
MDYLVEFQAVVFEDFGGSGGSTSSRVAAEVVALR